MQTLRILFVCLLLGIGPVTVNLAREVKLLDMDGKLGDAFGYVAISGDTAIVGAKGNDDPVQNGGAAHIFVRSKGEDNWIHHQKLAPPDVNNESQFGKAVGISGKYAIGGALEDDFKFQNAGSAYIYERTGKSWPQREKLIASDAAGGDEFGTSVAISGDTAIVGAPRHDGNKGKDSGSVYVFVNIGRRWKEQATFTASDVSAGDQLGTSVAISRDTVIVGAPGKADAGRESGAAYIFVRNGEKWKQQAKLTASDTAKRDKFGISVAINRNTVIVGALGKADAGASSGAAYIFVRNGEKWKQQVKLTAADGAQLDKFGISVSISHNTAIVGASGADGGGKNAGAAYSFQRTGTSWEQRAKVIPSDATESDQFGVSVAIGGEFVIVGTTGRDTFKGVAYIYRSIEDFHPVEPFGLTVTTLGQVKRTALYQNFPNPFNPETWLPYRLASAAQVTLRIYNVQGQLVRELDPGLQQPGGYLSRENAAYWDGTDQVGDAVSSGVYFYTLQANTFEATRSMVILK